MNYVAAENPDILIITETKVDLLASLRKTDLFSCVCKMNQAPITPALKERFAHQYWSISAKKGYCQYSFCINASSLTKNKQQELPSFPSTSL